MQKDKLIPLGLGVVVALLVGIIYTGGLFAGFEYFLGAQLLSPIGASEEIVIIAIDDDSIQKIGQWPWPRAEYAKLLEALDLNPPKVIGIDVLFAEPSRVGARDDEKFAAALSDAEFPIVLASREVDKIRPLDQFMEPKHVRTGDVLLIVDPDGVVRRTPKYGTFAVVVLDALCDCYQKPLPLEEIERVVRIAWVGPPGTFRRLPFWRVLEEEQLAESLAGKIVLVGSTATDLHDEQLTAIARGSAMPGVEIQANLVNMLREGVSMKVPGTLVQALLILLAALLPAVSFMFLPGMWRPILGALVIFLIWLIATVIAWGQNLALPIFYPFLAWFLSTSGQVLYRYFGAERSRREMRHLFGKYVSHDVLVELLKNPGQVKLGGEEREVTVLFSDVRDFTSLSEHLTPEMLTDFMNRYLSVMTDIILSNRGVVDKYIGDAIMAFWGAPVWSAEHGKDCVLAAAAMAEALTQVNEENKKLSLPPIEIGVGINSGQVVAGNMGSEQRMSYTIMGDSVNLASRLEGLTKVYGVRVIASDTVLAKISVPETIASGITFRELDRVRVKGKKNAVTIYEVLPPSLKEDYEKIDKRFDNAREYYYKGDWDKCLKLLAEIETILPGDNPTKLLRARCMQFKVVPPVSWDGTYEHRTK